MEENAKLALSSTATLVNKCGRKGDPRMHRSVAARLTNPNLTLFEALKQGGFNYSVDDDSQAIDSEQVTLGQRKNQLSRRLRIAKRDLGIGRSGMIGPDRRSMYYSYSRDGTNRKRSTQDVIDCLNETAQLLKEEDSCDVTQSLRKAKDGPACRSPISVPSSQCIPDPPYQRIVLEDAPSQKPQRSLNSVSQYTTQPAVSQLESLYTADMNLTSCSRLNGHNSHVGVAVSSLLSTAHRLGMTLEQFALSLSNPACLSQVLTATSRDSEDHKERSERLAMNLCLSEMRNLYRRSMLLAGFPIEQARDDSEACIEFTVKAWQLEGRRLGALIRDKNLKLLPLECYDNMTTTTTSSSSSSPTFPPTPFSEESMKSETSTTNQWRQNMSAASISTRSPVYKPNEENHSECLRIQSTETCPPVHSRLRVDSVVSEDGRHMHCLQGCGHKVLLHKPEDGEAHIDFIVGDKIECYQGLHPPLGSAEHTLIMNSWPSQYRCEEVSCENPKCTINPTATHAGAEEGASRLPKLLDLSSVDLDGKEWNVELDDAFFNLFKLPNATSGDDGTRGEEKFDGFT